jgi:hypothetical protein
VVDAQPVANPGEFPQSGHRHLGRLVPIDVVLPGGRV